MRVAGLVLVLATGALAGEPPRASDGPTHMVASFVLYLARVDLAQPAPPMASERILRSGVSAFGRFRVCVNKEGQVYDVKTLYSSLQDDTERWVSYYRATRYKAQRSNVCADINVKVQIGGPPFEIPENAKIVHVDPPAE
jgi:hypothetical protein